MQIDEEYLKDRYKKMNDEDLIKIFKEGGLTEKAEEILKDELKRRNVRIPSEDEINNYRKTREIYGSLDGFASGKLWILMAIIGFLVSFGRFLYYINSLPTLSIFSFFYGLLCIISAIGLIKRKKLGLYATYILLLVVTLNGITVSLANLLKSNFHTSSILLSSLTKIIGIPLISYLWFSYFKNRESWFK